MEKVKRKESIRINKVAVVLLSVTAYIIGLMPVVLFLRQPIILACVAIIVLFSSSLSIRKFTSRATEKPILAEFILGGIEAVSMPAFIGTIWLMLYGILYGLIKLILFIIQALGGNSTIDASLIASYPTIFVGGILAVTLSVSQAQDLCKRLYPDTAGVRTLYFRFFTSDRSRMLGNVIISLILLLVLWGLLTFNILNRTIIYILMQLAFFVIGSLFRIETRAERDEKKKRSDIVNLVEQLLRIADYETEISPRTQDASIDPLLANVDIFAQREKHYFLVDIKSPMDADKQVDWKSASTLIQSAYLLGSARAIKPSDIDACLLLVDVEPDRSLMKFNEQGQIRILRVKSRQIYSLLEMKNNEEQIRAIQQMLGLPRKVKRRSRSTKAQRKSPNHE